MSIVAPYGSWVSPISAADLVSSGHPVSGGCFVGDDIWWLEARPEEAGRLAVRRMENGEPTDVLLAPWNARTRVHEYGGGAWTTTEDGTLVFAEYSDQRLYRLDPGATEPVPLTPADQGMRFAELSIRGSEVIAVRETHGEERVARDIVAVPLDGSAQAEAGGIRSIVGGSRFLAYPRISPDGNRIAWIAWQHPQMPWDGTELRVGDLEDGVVTTWRLLIGGKSESVLQPEWVGNDALYAISDRSGWWNLYRIDAGGLTTALHPIEADMGGALWQLGARWYSILDDGSLLSVRTHGTDRLAVLEFSTGEFRDIDLPFASITLGGVNGNRLLTVCGGPEHAAGLREVWLTDGGVRDIRLAVDELPDADYLPTAEPSEFGGVPVVVYRPRNPEYTAPDGELPPFVAFVHGGPTAHVAPSLSLSTAYFTSRGIGVVEVNYGGSTGFGRAWRDRLKGQWGVVDVADTVGAIRALADAGIADPARLAIRGGSAGGLTVLAALEESDVFACGTSYYGVADLAALAADTHDFEARYLDGLVGPLPEATEVYRDRSPLGHVDRLSTPVLLLQGLDDPVVPPSQSETLRNALVAGGVPHAYVGYEGESHGFRKAETIIHAAQAELSFYGQVMGFEPPGTPELELWRP
ncbi:prolyl oligopeptidase family serine peptidase [Diaminobutyricimonas sp. LJ205]|uniref:dipeptidyl-peptidase 5 n=1 Tax=Diaminobutyricimonas sp. LJ205 TaxID=2683590 RepID=UPI0012F4780E|nr:prolyl oligopeptidase family serine peptidase [Diaminobutyricimonas sp. LJ205]